MPHLAEILVNVLATYKKIYGDQLYAEFVALFKSDPNAFQNKLAEFASQHQKEVTLTLTKSMLRAHGAAKA